jgi:hypothetical protein
MSVMLPASDFHNSHYFCMIKESYRNAITIFHEDFAGGQWEYQVAQVGLADNSWIEAGGTVQFRVGTAYWVRIKPVSGYAGAVVGSGTLSSLFTNVENDLGYFTMPDSNVQLAGSYVSNTPTTYSLGNLAFKDLNGNDVYDAGDQPFANLRLTLRNVSGTVVKITQTAADGSYIFQNLLEDDYIVGVPENDVLNLSSNWDASVHSSSYDQPF